MAKFRTSSIACADYDIDESSANEGSAQRMLHVNRLVNHRPKPKRRATTAQGPKGRKRRMGLVATPSE